MTARDDYRATEQRLAEVERQIEALRDWERDCSLRLDRIGRGVAVGVERPPYPGGDLSALLLERERLQEESYKAYRRVVAEREG